jgi:hypothetical protein
MLEWWERFDGAEVWTGQPETFLNEARLEDACRHLLACCLLEGKRPNMELKHWVGGDALYDQVSLARRFGIASHLAQRPLIARAYLRVVFFAAVVSLEARGLATLEEKAGQYSCVLTKEGRSLANKYDQERRAMWPRS